MHSPDATWETTLVIPETTKPIDVQTLDALLRIEELLQTLVAQTAPTVIAAAEPELDFDDEMNVIGTKKPKGKRK